MKKRNGVFLFVLALTCFLIGGCSQTKQVDQTKILLQDLRTLLAEQKNEAADFLDNTHALGTLITDNVHQYPKDAGIKEQVGTLYVNYEDRIESDKKIAEQSKEIESIQKKLESITKKEYSALPNQQLALLTQSIEILLKNDQAFLLFNQTGLNLEEKLYNSLPVDNLEERIDVLNRAYGSSELIVEEMNANYGYTNTLIKKVEKNIQSSNWQRSRPIWN